MHAGRTFSDVYVVQQVQIYHSDASAGTQDFCTTHTVASFCYMEDVWRVNFELQNYSSVQVVIEGARWKRVFSRMVEPQGRVDTRVTHMGLLSMKFVS